MRTEGDRVPGVIGAEIIADIEHESIDEERGVMGRIVENMNQLERETWT